MSKKTRPPRPKKVEARVEKRTFDAIVQHAKENKSTVSQAVNDLLVGCLFDGESKEDKNTTPSQ